MLDIESEYAKLLVGKSLYPENAEENKGNNHLLRNRKEMTKMHFAYLKGY